MSRHWRTLVLALVLATPMAWAQAGTVSFLGAIVQAPTCAIQAPSQPCGMAAVQVRRATLRLPEQWALACPAAARTDDGNAAGYRHVAWVACKDRGEVLITYP